MSSRHARRISNPLPYLGKLTLSAGVITDDTRLAGAEGDGEAYPDSSVGVWPAATNLVTNGNATTGTTGWVAAGTATLARVTDDGKFGTTCFKWTVGAAPGGEGVYSDATVTGATTGRTFTISRWIKGVGGSVGKTVRLVIRERGGASGTSTVAIAGFTLTSDWQLCSITGSVTQNDRTVVRNDIVVGSAGTPVTTADEVKFGGVSTFESAINMPYIETDGGTASRVAGTVAAPRQFLNPDGGGMAIRYRAGMAYTGGVSAETRIRLLNALNGNNWMILYYDYVTDKWLLGRDNGSGAGETVVSGVQSFALGDDLTIIAEWTPTLLSIQIDNAAPVTAASTKAPLEANLPATFGFGTTTEPPRGDLLWAYGWSGVLSTADRALLVALGDNDPLPHQLRGAATPSFLAHFNGDGTMYRYAA